MDRAVYRWSVTPAGWSYVGATGVVGLSAVLTQANLLFFLVGLLVGALVLDGLWAGLSLWGVTVRRYAPSRGLAGEAMAVRYVVGRGGWLPLGAVIVSEVLAGVRQEGGYCLYLARKGRATAEATLYPEVRGVLALEAVRVRSSFPFGLVRGERRFGRVSEVLVYPRVYRVTRELRATSGVWRDTGKAEVDSRSGAGDFAGLREYRPGDAVRSIDWKRTARLGTLMVREHLRPVPPRVMLCLDMSSGSPTGGEVEQAVTLVASMVCAAQGHGMPVGLVIVGGEGSLHRPHASLPHRDDILETLARMVPGRGAEVGRAAQLRPSMWVLASPTGVAPRAPDLMVLHGGDSARLLDTSASGLPLDPLPSLAALRRAEGGVYAA
ncbi:MAG: DUF58 domain-containing protein [Phycisphaeraceae bacterium]